ncbi:lysophospholipase, putative [Plasmodium chabaudi chabaudi]|uniref:Lysophospholipase, putative n=1 Tax=Plasmodium chabaudi chabaudi TaxID=31271 RepID=A0A1D3L7B8_PLACU|nr:lysophospholipase, putative [Plasmodium chabaudi chabaudi]
MEEIELNDGESRSTTVSKLDGDPKTGWLRNKKGLLLKTYAWIVQNPIGNVLLIHGFRAHTRLAFMRINLQMPNNNEDLVVDSDNYYIYKDSWIEKFNQNGYSVYALDLQGHGESQAWKNIKGDFSSFDDLVDDVIQYMNHIQDEIENDNKTDDESHNVLATKKKKLPMYVVGYSMGGNIVLRALQLLNKKKRSKNKAKNSNNYKKSKKMLCNSNNINETGNDMYDMNNSSDYGSDKSGPSTYTMASANSSDKHLGYYNLDKFNIKGCVSLSSMLKLNETRNAGNNSIKYLYLPVAGFLSLVAPNAKRPSGSGYKQFEYITNTYKYDKFRNPSGTKFKHVYELLKATVTVNCNINYMPKDIPVLFVHSTDDSVCCLEGTVSFHSKAKIEKKDIHIVEDMDHAVTAAPGNEEILNKIIDWIYDLRSNNEDKKENEI